MTVPRILGKVGRAAEPPEVAGKWFFTVWVTTLGAGLPADDEDGIGPFGPFETEEEAQKELRHACQLGCNVLEKELTGGVSGKYVDMKTNLTRRWDRSDEN